MNSGTKTILLLNDTTGVYNESYSTNIGTNWMKMRNNLGLMFGNGYLLVDFLTMTKVSSAVTITT